MATKWSGVKVDKSILNNGNEYEIDDAVAIEEFNAIVNNSLYASEKVDTVIGDAEAVVEQGKTDILIQTAEGKYDISKKIAQGKSELNEIVDEAETLVEKSNASINTVVGTANNALNQVEQVLRNEGYWGSNPNLLINGDFKVNQRGFKRYNHSGQHVDGWNQYGGLLIVPVEDGISVTRTTTGAYSEITQLLKNSDTLSGKNVTLSVCVDGVIYSKTYLLSTTMIISNLEITGMGVARAQYSANYGEYYVGVYDTTAQNPNANAHIINWVKLEIGSVSTAYSPKPYEEELADCQCIEGGIATTYSNPNLLINGDFRVNQRGFDGTNIVRNRTTYCFDRWRYYQWGNSAEITKNDDGSITIYNTTTDTSQENGSGILYFSQPLEYFAPRVCNNETYTISCKYKIEYPDSNYKGDCYFYFETDDSIPVIGTRTMKIPITDTPAILTETFTINGTTTKGFTAFNLRRGAKLTIYWVKLEKGVVATDYKPRPYGEELQLCQRYYQVINNLRLTGSVAAIGYATTTITYLTQMLKEPTITILNPVTIRYGGVNYTQTSATTNAWWRTTNELVISFNNFSNNPLTSFWNSMTNINVLSLEAEY